MRVYRESLIDEFLTGGHNRVDTVHAASTIPEGGTPVSDAPEKKERIKQAAGIRSLPKMSSPGHNHKYDVCNEKFAKEDSAFNQACDKVGIKPTARQASKWRNKKGKAYMEGR